MKLDYQKGLAVITAMLLVALIGAIAGALIYEQQRFINQLSNHLSAAQERQIGEAAIQWSRAILAEDAKSGSVDHLKENWAIQLPDTPIEGGKIRGSITDEQQYCNLNNLMRTGSNAADAEFFKHLMSSIGGNPAVIDALTDWIDADSEITYPYGAEDSQYLTMPVPYRTANQPLTEIGNLSRVSGFTAENIARLRQYCVVLPEPTPVNINTTSAELIELMVPELSTYEVQLILAERERHPFNNLNDLNKLLDDKKINFTEDRFSVGSRYFLVTSYAQFGNSTMRIEALLKREGGGWPKVIWKRYR